MYWKAFLAEALMFCTILTCSGLGAYSKTALFWLGIAKFWGHGGAPERPLCTTAPRSRCKGQWSPTCCWCTGRGWRWWSSCALVFSLGTCGVGRDDQTAMQQYTPKYWPVLTSPCFSVTCCYHICFTKRPPSTQWVKLMIFAEITGFSEFYKAEGWLSTTNDIPDEDSVVTGCHLVEIS